MFGKKTKSLIDYDANNSVATKFKGNLTCNGVTIFESSDNKEHTFEIRNGSIVIDGKDNTKNVVDTMKSIEQEIEDTYEDEDEKSVYFNNLTIQVSECNELNATSSNNISIVNTNMNKTDTNKTDTNKTNNNVSKTTSIVDYNPNIHCKIQTDGAIDIQGNVQGYLKSSDCITIRDGSFKGSIETDSDVTIENGNLYLENWARERKSSMEDLEVNGDCIGSASVSGSLYIHNASIVQGDFNVDDTVDITYVENANINVDIKADSDVSIEKAY